MGRAARRGCQVIFATSRQMCVFLLCRPRHNPPIYSPQSQGSLRGRTLASIFCMLFKSRQSPGFLLAGNLCGVGKTLKTAKGAFSVCGGDSPFRRKGKHHPASRYLVWHINGNTAGVGNIHSLRNAHKANITPKKGQSKEGSHPAISVPISCLKGQPHCQTGTSTPFALTARFSLLIVYRPCTALALPYYQN